MTGLSRHARLSMVADCATFRRFAAPDVSQQAIVLKACAAGTNPQRQQVARVWWRPSVTGIDETVGPTSDLPAVGAGGSAVHNRKGQTRDWSWPVLSFPGLAFGRSPAHPCLPDRRKDGEG